MQRKYLLKQKTAHRDWRVAENSLPVSSGVKNLISSTDNCIKCHLINHLSRYSPMDTKGCLEKIPPKKSWILFSSHTPDSKCHIPSHGFMWVLERGRSCFSGSLCLLLSSHLPNTMPESTEESSFFPSFVPPFSQNFLKVLPCLTTAISGDKQKVHGHAV